MNRNRRTLLMFAEACCCLFTLFASFLCDRIPLHRTRAKCFLWEVRNVPCWFRNRQLASGVHPHCNTNTGVEDNARVLLVYPWYTVLAQNSLREDEVKYEKSFLR